MSRRASPFGAPFTSSQGGQYAGSRPRSNNRTRKTSSRGRTVVTAADISRLLDAPNPQQEAVVISANELRTMKINSNLDGKKQPSARSATLAAKADARRKKMKKIDEAQRLKREALTDSERQAVAAKNEILDRARRRLDEEKDDVKHMSSMMKYAKCVTIRDAQILEKQQIQQQQAEQDRRMDMMMEVERIKNIKLTQQREQVRAQERKQGAMVIIQQIAEREAERIRQQEIREQEAKAMIERIRDAEHQEHLEQLRKKEEGRRLLQNVLHANEMQARAKLIKKQEALEEDMQIAEYIRQKELRQQAAEKQAAHVRAEKEKEISRLRALQEKAQDRQSTIDELRAKRYQEQKDRMAREQQLALARKKERVVADLANARENQRRVKAQRMADQAMQEREEYYRVLEWQKAQMEADNQKAYEQQRARHQHREALMDQINEHEHAKSEARQKFLEDGQRMAAEMAAEHRRLQQLKDEKLQSLSKVGVPQKYRAELAKKKLLVSTIY